MKNACRNALTTLIAALVATSAFAQAVSPNIARGFEADKVYAVGEIDVVNVFNGNVNIPFPIGTKYSVSPNLSYQFVLFYGGNSWEYETRSEWYDSGGGPELEEHMYGWSYPSRRDNAGLGWRLSFGRLYAAAGSGCTQRDLYPLDEPEGNLVRMGYESPDGAMHCFYDTLHEGRAVEKVAGSNTYYTRDGSYLRLRKAGVNWQIEFPDGAIHEFPEPPGTDAGIGVTKMRDRYENYVTVDYAATGTPAPAAFTPVSTWKIEDSFGRQHYVHFRTTASYNETSPYSDGVVAHASVGEIRLASVDDPADSSDGVAVYSFHYYGESGSWPTIARTPKPEDTIMYANLGLSVAATLLESIVENWTGGDTYTFDYNRTGGIACQYCSGAITSFGLPTGAAIQWAYENLAFPVYANASWNPKTHQLAMRTAAAVKSRSISGAAGLIAKRQYERTAPPDHEAIMLDRVLVTDYAADATTILRKSEYFFSLCTANCTSPITRGEYGLPFSKIPRTTPVSHTDLEGRYLSSVEYGPGAGWTQVLRKTYVQYEADVSLTSTWPGNTDQNRRQLSQRVYYADDADNWTKSVSSDFDGLGHYRTATSISSFDPVERIQVTKYNPARGTYPSSFSLPALSSPWLLNLYESSTAREGTGTSVTEFWFDETNGFLKRRRQIKDLLSGARGVNDVIALFVADARGNVTAEEWYGGDENAQTPESESVGTQTLDAATLGRRTTRIEYKPVAPPSDWTITAKYTGTTFFTTDVTVDKNTGTVIRSRDTAGKEAVYKYDPRGRPVAVIPTGRAWTEYTYSGATPSTPAKVVVKQYPNAQTIGPLTTTTYEYDALGRPVLERRSMPGNAESRRETQYNALGWQTSVSELGSAATLPVSTFTYDALGRVLTAKASDGSQTQLTYTGKRIKTKTSTIAMSAGSTESSVTTTEQYDADGRLIKQTERAGPTSATSTSGADVVTEYGYDVANRLTSVKMKGVEPVVQQRLFDYDGRGFLLWESHPESGMTAYTYDARGRILTRTQAGANSQYNLRFEYDSAERVTRLLGRNPSYPDNSDPEFRVMKEFTYAAENAGSPVSDWRKGRLLTATRYNYGPVNAARGYLSPTYKVSETYSYDSAGRRVKRDTSVTRGSDVYWAPVYDFTQSVEYNDLDLPREIKYPKCVWCGLPSGGPERNLQPSYDRGRVTTVPGYVSSVSYWPNGMWKERLHQNGMVDRQGAANDGSGMARPLSLLAEAYSACTAPLITAHPTGGKITSAGQTVTLQVSVQGSGLTYQWYKDGVAIDDPAARMATYVVQPATTSRYHVEVTNACRSVRSATALVSVNECTPPSVNLIEQSRNLDGTVTLALEGFQYQGWGGTGPLTFTWYRKSDNAVVGSGTKITVGPLSATTSYSVTVTNDCGGSAAIRETRVEVPLPMTSSGLSATRNSDGSGITVSWPASSGAAKYVVERRVGGNKWTWLAESSTTSYPDTSVMANVTYAYRIYALDAEGFSRSSYSNADVASMTTFASVTAGSTILAGTADEVLRAVNLVRGVSGWPALTWSSIIASAHPLPAVGGVIPAMHLMTCRSRMNEALQALGVALRNYTDADLQGQPASATHVNELLERAQ